MTAALKLYVWEDVLCDHTCGVMFALAGSVDEARRLILERCPFAGNSIAYYEKTGDMEYEINFPPTHVFDSPVGFAVLGGA